METVRTSELPLRRRSQRIPLAVPLFVTSLDPQVEFGERCETLVVSNHGCEIRATKPLPQNTTLRLDVMHSKQVTTAHVVRCEPAGLGGKGWQIALALDKAENFWGIKFPPEDWLEGSKKVVEEQPAAEEARAADEPPSGPPSASAGAPAAPAAPAAAMSTPPAGATPPKPVPPPPRMETPAAPPPAAVQGLTPPEAARSAAPPDSDQAPARFEALLREKAKGISAEFEDSYRRSLGDLLVRLRADLEERATADWTGWRDQARLSLVGVAMEVRQQISQETEQRRRQMAELDTKLQALQTLQAQIEARLGTADETLREQLARERDQWAAQTREATQALLQEMHQQARGLAGSAQPTAELQAQLEEVRRTRDYVESLVRLLPETVDQRVREGVAATLERVRDRMEEEFTAQREGQTEELVQHLLRVAQQSGDDLRQKLLEDLDRSEREFLDRVQVRLEEARAVEGGLREDARRLADDLTGKAAELRAALVASLDQQAQQLNLRAETAMRKLGEQTWNALYQRLRSAFDDRQQALQQRLQSVETAAVGLEGRTADLTTKVESGLEARLEQAAGDLFERIRQRLEQLGHATREQEFAAIEERLDLRLAPLVTRGEATAETLRLRMESCRQEHAQLETQMAANRQEIEQVRTWLTQETQQFQKLVHEALIDAAGQIKGRIQQALEMSQEPLERRGGEIRTQLEELAAARSAELGLRIGEAEERLRNLEKQVEASADASLRVRMADALARFEDQSGDLAQKSMTELQVALSEALESMARVFRDKFGKDS